MGHPRFEEWLVAIGAGRAERNEAWDEVCAHAHKLDRGELSELVRALELEHNRSGPVDERLKELDFKINLLIRLLAAQPWNGEPQTTFGEWFFGPLRPRLGGTRVSNPCSRSEER